MPLIREGQPRPRPARVLLWVLGVLGPVLLVGVFLAAVPVEVPLHFQFGGTPYTAIAVEAGHTDRWALADVPQGLNPFSDSSGMSATLGWTVRVGNRVYALVWLQSSSRSVR
jgi:hypothetical protein